MGYHPARTQAAAPVLVAPVVADRGQAELPVAVDTEAAQAPVPVPVPAVAGIEAAFEQVPGRHTDQTPASVVQV